MSYTGLLNATGTISRQGTSVGSGLNPRTGYAVVATGVRCRVQLTGGPGNTTDERATDVGEYTGFFLLDTDIRVEDRLLVDGETYKVDRVDPNTAGSGHHREVRLKKVGLNG